MYQFRKHFLGGLRRHLQYQFPHSKFVKFYLKLLLKLSGTDIKHRINLLRKLKTRKVLQKKPSQGHSRARDMFSMYAQFD
jgi:hypothetical protein